MRHLLSCAGLGADTATAILDTAGALKQALLGREVRKLPTLRGRTVITMFYENSTRTRVSFEIAGKWMSADVVNVSSGGSSVSKGESLRDTALTLAAAGADCVIVRHPASGAAQILQVGCLGRIRRSSTLATACTNTPRRRSWTPRRSGNGSAASTAGVSPSSAMFSIAASRVPTCIC